MMPSERWIIVLLAAIGFVLPCCNASREEVPSSVPEGQWSCFNGCAIVRHDGRFGLIREEDGTVLLPARYASIEFLDNDIALLTDSLSGSLCDRSGRILFQAADADSLRRDYAAIVEGVREGDRYSWEQVLSDYDRLCRLCKDRHGKTVRRKEWLRLINAARQVDASLQSVSGKPTPSQKARLEAISDDYRRAFR